MSKICTCLSISRDPLCAFHGDVDKIAAIAAASVPSPPAQPKEWECVCTHHYRAHDRFTGRCTEGGCECSGYVDGPATFYLAAPSQPAEEPK